MLLKSVLCGYSSQEGCVGTSRLLVVIFRNSAPANAGLGLATMRGKATGMTKRSVPEHVLGQIRHARSDVSSWVCWNAGRHDAVYRLAERKEASLMLDVWVVSKCAICEEMKLYFDGRLTTASLSLFCCSVVRPSFVA